MLDTIALTLDQHQFEILEPDRFSPSALGLLRPPYYPLGARGHFPCVLNPLKSDLAAGRYLPRLTLSKRKAQAAFVLTLRIEFSAPKLIFGNNFDELRSRDFEAVLTALHRRLGELGIRVSDSMLRAARVSAVHYSKNMAFTDFTSCAMVIDELDLIDLSGRMDLSHTDYRNEGHAIRYHANSFELVFYDKLRDLQKACISEKRALERGSAIQIGLFRECAQWPKTLEVLRMELRLGSRARIARLMRELGIRIEPTFAGVFDKSIAQEALQHFWTGIRRQLPMPGATELRPEDLFQALAVAANGTAGPGKLLQQLGGALLVASVGYRGAAALMGRHCSKRSWQRHKRELKALPALGGTRFAALDHVDKALAEFKPLRLADFRLGASRRNIEGLQRH